MKINPGAKGYHLTDINCKQKLKSKGIALFNQHCIMGEEE